MKTVWILNQYAQEPGGPGGTRHFDLARHLRAHGWRAILVAANVDYFSRRERTGSDKRWGLDIIDGVEFLWLPGRGYDGNGRDRVRGILQYTRAALRVPPSVLP